MCMLLTKILYILDEDIGCLRKDNKYFRVFVKVNKDFDTKNLIIPETVYLDNVIKFSKLLNFIE